MVLPAELDEINRNAVFVRQSNGIFFILPKRVRMKKYQIQKWQLPPGSLSSTEVSSSVLKVKFSMEADMLKP